MARTLSREKARTVAAMSGPAYVVGCDQTLALGERRFSKPADRAAARDQLMALRGKTHQLHSAVAVCRNGSVTFNYVIAAQLKMREFSKSSWRPIWTCRQFGTVEVGAYHLEGTGGALLEKVEGDNFTVLGMPLLPLLEWLRGAKLRES